MTDILGLRHAVEVEQPEQPEQDHQGPRLVLADQFQAQLHQGASPADRHSCPEQRQTEPAVTIWRICRSTTRTRLWKPRRNLLRTAMRAGGYGSCPRRTSQAEYIVGVAHAEKGSGRPSGSTVSVLGARVLGAEGAEGAQGFVLGFLAPDGSLDLAEAEAVLAELEGCRWTFHRALDRVADHDHARKALADLSGLDAYLTAGSADGVDEGLPLLLSEAARRSEPGYVARIMVRGGLTMAHLPRLRTAGIDAFHIGGAARPQGWDAPVSASAVAEWRKALSQPPAAGRFGDG